jgi:hypothetical protein
MKYFEIIDDMEKQKNKYIKYIGGGKWDAVKDDEMLKEVMLTVEKFLEAVKEMHK